MKQKNKQTIRVASAVLACALVAITVSGCSLFPSKTKAPEVPKIITIWGFDDDDLWQPLFKDSAFKKLTTGYTVNYVKKTLSDTYENDALNSILSGQGPDVWEIPNDWVFRHKEQLTPMPATLLTGDFTKQYVPSLVESSVFDDNIYSFSPSVDTLMLYYNQKLLDQATADYTKANQPAKAKSETQAQYAARDDVKQYNEMLKIIGTPPTSWANLDTATKFITKRNGNDITVSGLALGATNNVANSADIVYALMLQNKVKMTNDNRDLATFNLPTKTASGEEENLGKYALEYYAKFSDPSSPYYSWNSSMPNNLDAFAQGKVAYIIAPGSASGYFQQQYPSITYKTTMLPKVDSKSDEYINYAKFMTYSIPKLSNFPTLSWQIALRAPFNRNLVTSSVTNSRYKEKPQDVKQYQANTSHVWIKGRYPTEVDAIFKTVMDNLTSGKQSSSEAVNTAATRVTDLFRKQGW